MSKNKLFAIAILGIIGLGFVAFSCYSVYAQDYGLGTAAGVSGLAESKISQTQNIPRMLGTIVSVLLSLVGVIFFLLILFAGFTWMTAAGSTEKVEKSKKMLQNAAIGLVAVLSAYTLANFVFSTFLRPTNETCKTTPPGVAALNCEKGKVCGDGQACVDECVFIYSKLDSASKCIDVSTDVCDGYIIGGKCSGNINQMCCVTQAAKTQYDNLQTKAALEAGGEVPEAAATTECAESGFFCASEAACTNQNGKSQGEMGCSGGAVCCKSCFGSGGNCMDTESGGSMCSPETKLKPGYCFGVYDDAKYQCCFGIIVPLL